MPREGTAQMAVMEQPSKYFTLGVVSLLSILFLSWLSFQALSESEIFLSLFLLCAALAKTLT